MLHRWWISFLIWRGVDTRGLFRFHDGARWRCVDPFPVLRALLSAEKFDWDETLKLMETHNLTIQLESFQMIGEAVRSAFKAPELTETECLSLLTQFRGYLGNVKKNGSLFPTLPDSTESKPLAGSAEKPVSASFSTPIAPSLAPAGLPAAAMPV